MKKLIFVPSDFELKIILSELNNLNCDFHKSEDIGRNGYYSSETNSILVKCGIGKVNAAINTLNFINKINEIEYAVLVGASGSLTNKSNIGDVIIGTKSIEHDIIKKSRIMMPEISYSENLLHFIENLDYSNEIFKVLIGPIASGDEDILDGNRKIELQKKTNCVAVAWEGIGFAKACSSNNVPSLEIRGISDLADKNGEQQFFNNIEDVLKNTSSIVNKLIKKDE